MPLLLLLVLWYFLYSLLSFHHYLWFKITRGFACCFLYSFLPLFCIRLVILSTVNPVFVRLSLIVHSSLYRFFRSLLAGYSLMSSSFCCSLTHSFMKWFIMLMFPSANRLIHLSVSYSISHPCYRPLRVPFIISFPVPSVYPSIWLFMHIFIHASTSSFIPPSIHSFIQFIFHIYDICSHPTIPHPNHISVYLSIHLSCICQSLAVRPSSACLSPRRKTRRAPDILYISVCP